MIKSDRWIRNMAALGMIDPFVGYQVRSVPVGPHLLEVVTKKVISYGTSSYGFC